MVISVLIGFVVLSVPALAFSLLLISGERRELKRMRELDETGIEVQARLTRVMPVGTKGYGRVLYEFDVPDGETVRYEKPDSLAPLHVVGATFPLVHHPRNTKSLHMGTKAVVRKERKSRESSVKLAYGFTSVSAAVCALAIVGLVLSP
ncbi:hypothetical protein [Streptomyces sp. NPDC093600]|uniref:hypothetical protein n=1 Tax=Streptomyces sp. NPDC093600 TaxID=3366047 RepID=UPI0037F2BEC4